MYAVTPSRRVRPSACALSHTNILPITHCAPQLRAQRDGPAANRTQVFPPVSGSWHQPSSLRGLPLVCAMRSDLSPDGYQITRDSQNAIPEGLVTAPTTSSFQQPSLTFFGPNATGDCVRQFCQQGSTAACESDCVTQHTQQGVIYCQHTIRFHGTRGRAASFTPQT